MSGQDMDECQVQTDGKVDRRRVNWGSRVNSGDRATMSLRHNQEFSACFDAHIG